MKITIKQALVLGPVMVVGFVMMAALVGFVFQRSAPPVAAASAAPSQWQTEIERAKADELEQVRVREAKAKWDARKPAMASMKRLDLERVAEECSDTAACDIDDFANSVPQNERANFRAAYGAKLMAKTCALAKDGESLSPLIPIVSLALTQGGSQSLAKLYSANLAEAKKDSDATRGKRLEASGRVIEIRREKDIYFGSLLTPGGTVLTFVTPFTTDGVFANTQANLVGAYVQEYAYKNTGGGQTRSLLVVGLVQAP
jgi:hypothetical protein